MMTITVHWFILAVSSFVVGFVVGFIFACYIADQTG
jgi:uncharacterized membrane protein YqaE (UPF0057 family)